MTVLAITREPADWLAAAALAAWCLWSLLRTRCTCPDRCSGCPPLTDDDQADAEFRATRHMFTGRGAHPGRR